MKRSSAAVLVLAAAFISAGAARAQNTQDMRNTQNSEDAQNQNSPQGTFTVSAVDATAQVLKADVSRRTITIKDPAGKRVTINVPPELSMDEFKTGALLDVRYIESQAVAIGKPGEAATSEGVQTVTLAPESGSPSEVTATTRRVSGMIKDIDRSKRELTIVGPDRRNLTMKVGADVSGFDDAKIGDSAVIDYTDAIAITAVQHSKSE